MAIWAVAQLHLLFAAFVLAVPLFAFIIEVIGYKTGDLRYDRLAHEFTKLLSVSFSLTATFGAFLTFMLIILYPKFTNYLMSVFSPTFLPYVLLFFAEAFFLYTYYYGWGKFHPLVHLGLGLGLNLVGTAIMFIANAWLTFMMSPNGVSDTGAVISVMDAVYNFTWMPINVHRVIANIAFGGSVAAAYAAFKFLQAKSDEERAHYDWMGYIGNFVAISAFLPLPFAGYWLASEIYAYSQTLGLTMMGGAFSWLFIIQAVLIGNLFLAANFYLWLGMGRVEEAQPLQKFVKYLLIAIALCFMVWATPRSIIATVSELRAMGGSAHPILGFLGVMSAKNTAVNILILTTFMSFLLYRRTGKVATVPWAKMGHAAQLAIFASVAIFVIFLGVYGYFVEATRQDWPLGAPGRLGSVRHGVNHRDRHLPLPRGEDGRGALGKDPGDLPVRADLHRGHLHLAHGTHGLRSVRAPPALACLRRHSGQLGRRLHAHPRLRDAGRLGDRARSFFLLIGFVFWITSLHERAEHRADAPSPQDVTHTGGQIALGGAQPSAVTEMRGLSAQDIEGRTQDVMTIPHAPRIGVLVLATTGFYGYVGQMVPQSEVQPPEEIVIRADLTTADMVKVGREIMDGKGLCLTCHTIGQSGALRFPDLEGVAGRAAERVPGLSDARLPRPIAVRT